MYARLKLSVGLRVRAARRQARLTQEQLAEKIKRTPESVSNIERGQQLPSLETLAELARVLKVPIVDFFEDGEGSAASASRQAAEIDIRQIVRALSDRDLAIAAKQMAAFLPKSNSRK